MTDPYLDPRCRPSTLDSFANRTLILRCIKSVLPQLEGTVFDIGCGHMPYRSLILSPPSRATKYVGIDLPNNPYSQPDIVWDGKSVAQPDNSADVVFLTEVLEHCPNPSSVLQEAIRLLKPGGLLFLTVPFIWPIHCVPHDEFRYTPFALERIVREVGFQEIQLRATGGRNAVLAIMLGLWIRRRPLTSRVHLVERWVLSRLLWPVIYLLFSSDVPQNSFEESSLIVGLAGTARKPGA